MTAPYRGHTAFRNLPHDRSPGRRPQGSSHTPLHPAPEPLTMHPSPEPSPIDRSSESPPDQAAPGGRRLGSQTDNGDDQHDAVEMARGLLQKEDLGPCPPPSATYGVGGQGPEENQGQTQDNEGGVSSLASMITPRPGEANQAPADETDAVPKPASEDEADGG